MELLFASEHNTVNVWFTRTDDAGQSSVIAPPKHYPPCQLLPSQTTIIFKALVRSCRNVDCKWSYNKQDTTQINIANITCLLFS
jgi:hypothetical protein